MVDPAGAAIDIGWRETPRPDSDGLYGRIEAIDLTDGRSLWKKRQRAPLSSSLLSTAGGLIFSGDRDRWFRALSAATGEELWRTRLNAAPNSSPISFAVGGRQYIAVIAGGGTVQDMMVSQYTPEIVNPAPGTTVWVFALPD